MFWKGWLLVRGCSYHFFPEDMAQKYSKKKWAIFRSMCPKTLIKVISGYHDLGILFCLWKKFGRFETVSKSWCIPNYQISVFSKTHHFLLPDFRRIREISFWIKSFMANCLNRRDQMVYSIFQNHAPRGTKVFKRFQSGRKYLSRLTDY